MYRSSDTEEPYTLVNNKIIQKDVYYDITLKEYI